MPFSQDAGQGAPAPLADLEARLAALEAENRRWRRSAIRSRRGLALLGAGLLGAIGLAAAQPDGLDVVQTNRLEIVDRAGNLVLAAAADEQGGRLDLWDANGRNVIRLASNPAGGDMNIWNRDGAPVFGAYASENGAELGLWSAGGVRTLRGSSSDVGGRLELASAGGSTEFVAEAAALGGSLTLHDAQGRARLRSIAADDGVSMHFQTPDEKAALTLDADGAGGAIALHHPTGDPLFAVDASAGRPRMMLSNLAERPILSVQSDAQVGGVLALADQNGRRRTTLTAEATGGSIACLNANEQSAFVAGVSPQTASGFVDLANGDGQRILALGAEADGCGRIDLSNASGQTVTTLDGIAGVGAAFAMFDERGSRAVLLGTRAEGGLLNLFNEREVSVFVAGYAEGDLGGALSIKNARGLPVFQVTSDRDDNGMLRVFDAQGQRPRTIKHAFE